MGGDRRIERGGKNTERGGGKEQETPIADVTDRSMKLL